MLNAISPKLRSNSSSNVSMTGIKCGAESGLHSLRTLEASSEFPLLAGTLHQLITVAGRIELDNNSPKG